MKDANAICIGIGRNDTAGADNDAKLAANIAKQHGFKCVTVLTNAKATKVRVVEAINKLKANENEHSTVFFFFSGHSNRNCIVLWDGLIMDYQLKNLFADLKSRKALFIIQGCFSGGLIEALKGEGRIVVTSAKADHMSADGKPYTVFGTLFLLKGMKQKQADANLDGKVSIQEAIEFCPIGDHWIDEMWSDKEFIL